ncbi:MAG: hypothetical protein ACK5WW_08825 [Brevundimonas sp.]|jgi:hypothetical protein|uniref:hypothetical protein n=1 Tax=Brevundimonas sp. TaxID=1871086 RepID=UPI003918CC45
MTALALDVRELSFEEIDFVSGGHDRSPDPRQQQINNIRDGLIVAAILYAARHPVVWLAAGIWALTATPAHGNNSHQRSL